MPHSSYIEKSVTDKDEPCPDLKERLMVDIFSKIRQEQIEDKQKRIVASANTVAAKKGRATKTDGSEKDGARSVSENYRPVETSSGNRNDCRVKFSNQLQFKH